MLRAGARRNLLMTPKRVLLGADVPLPAALAGSVARWDAYSGIVADATNGGFKWSPETGSSALQSVSGTGPDYSPTGLGGRPAMLLSTGKSLTTSPAVSTISLNVWFFAVVQMAAPANQIVLLGNSLASGAPSLRISPDGSVEVQRTNQAVVASYPAGTFPFNRPVSLFYSHTGTGNHILRINKVAITPTTSANGSYSTTANTIQIGRQGAAGGAADFSGLIGFLELGLAATPPTGASLTGYESTIYDRWAA